jgi:hypothetical protein
VGIDEEFDVLVVERPGHQKSLAVFAAEIDQALELRFMLNP